MTDLPPAPPPERTFNVVYDATNADLGEEGQLVVTGGGAAFHFSGRKRIPFVRKEISLELLPDNIRNAFRSGTSIQFTTEVGQSGKTKRPFGFKCASEEDAVAVLALLPTTLDEDGKAERDFGARLAQLPGGASVYGSVAFALIAINVAVFAVMVVFLDAGLIDSKLRPYVLYGANNGGATTDGEWWRLVTSMFMHYGIIHLALNMWTLFNLSGLLERLAGRALFLVIYLGAGLGGAFASLGWNGDRIWSAGASGAVFGLCGAMVGYLVRERGAIPSTVVGALFKNALWFIAYNLLFGLSKAGIDNAAHIGGLVTGFVLGALTAMPIDLDRRAKVFQGRVALGIGAVAALLIAGILLTPRYDYRFRDELAWGDLFQDVIPKEKSLLETQKQLSESAGSKAGAAKYADWIEREFVPFYREMVRRMQALTLAPGRATALRREAMRQFATAHTEALTHLAVGLRTDNKAELERYQALEREAQAALARTQKK